LVVLTRAINGGLNGFKERQRLSKTALTAFGDTQGADSIKLQ
jgi:predicted chitinase